MGMHECAMKHSAAEPKGKSGDLGPVTSKEAFSRAEHCRRYAHRCSVVFKDRLGQWYCVSYCTEAIKRGMLAMGTRGHMYVLGEEGRHRSTVGWREGCVRLRTSGRQAF